MTKNTYNFQSSVLVKTPNHNHRLQLADATEHGGNEGEYRIYLNRRWVDGFFTMQGVLRYATTLINAEPEPMPDLKRNDRVTVHYEHDGNYFCEGAYLNCSPIMGIHGKWVVSVNVSIGEIWVDCNDITKRGK